MERAILIFSFIVTGWLPLLSGLYLASMTHFAFAIGCMIVSFCGFRQIYENYKYQELIKEQKRRLVKNYQEIEQRDRIINKLYDYYN